MRSKRFTKPRAVADPDLELRWGPDFFFLLPLPTLPPPAVFSQNIGGPCPRAPPLDSPLPKGVDEDFMCNYVRACAFVFLAPNYRLEARRP